VYYNTYFRIKFPLAVLNDVFDRSKRKCDRMKYRMNCSKQDFHTFPNLHHITSCVTHAQFMVIMYATDIDSVDPDEQDSKSEN
jgi:hypothetical protein